MRKIKSLSCLGSTRCQLAGYFGHFPYHSLDGPGLLSDIAGTLHCKQEIAIMIWVQCTVNHFDGLRYSVYLGKKSTFYKEGHIQSLSSSRILQLILLANYLLVYLCHVEGR